MVIGMLTLKKNIILTLFLIALCIPNVLLTQDILLDDFSFWAPRSQLEVILDSLEYRGINLHYTSEGGWADLNDMDALWIHHFDSHILYDEFQISEIIEFAQNGGRIAIFVVGDTSNKYINPLLTDQRWEPTMFVGNVWGSDPEGVNWIEINSWYQFPPFTNGIEPTGLQWGPIIICGDNAYPWAFLNYPWTLPEYSHPIAAISYPFVYEENCSSFIVLVTGTGPWEANPFMHDEVQRWVLNIVYTAAGLEGYELEPGAVPGGGNACAEEPEIFSLCSATPNPFTPNGDGIYDEVEFTFPGIGENEATIKIFTLGNLKVRTIEVPAGAGAKQSATWDGTDNAGEPLLQGIYLYIIKSQGRIICKGTITLVR